MNSILLRIRLSRSSASLAANRPRPRLDVQVGETVEVRTGPLTGLPFLRRVEPEDGLDRYRCWIVLSLNPITVQNLATGEVQQIARDQPDRFAPQELVFEGFPRNTGIAYQPLAYAMWAEPTPRPSTAPFGPEADLQGHKLFLSLLSLVQRQQFERWSSFGIIGSRGGRYLVDMVNTDVMAHRTAQLWTAQEGHCVYLCYQTDGFLPRPDRTIGWKMFIEGNEDEVHLAAVPSPYRDPQKYARIMDLTNEVLREQRRPVRSESARVQIRFLG